MSEQNNLHILNFLLLNDRSKIDNILDYISKMSLDEKERTRKICIQLIQTKKSEQIKRNAFYLYRQLYCIHLNYRTSDVILKKYNRDFRVLADNKLINIKSYHIIDIENLNKNDIDNICNHKYIIDNILSLFPGYINVIKNIIAAKIAMVAPVAISA